MTTSRLARQIGGALLAGAALAACGHPGKLQAHSPAPEVPLTRPGNGPLVLPTTTTTVRPPVHVYTAQPPTGVDAAVRHWVAVYDNRYSATEASPLGWIAQASRWMTPAAAKQAASWPFHRGEWLLGHASHLSVRVAAVQCAIWRSPALPTSRSVWVRCTPRVQTLANGHRVAGSIGIIGWPYSGQQPFLQLHLVRASGQAPWLIAALQPVDAAPATNG